MKATKILNTTNKRRPENESRANVLRVQYVLYTWDIQKCEYNTDIITTGPIMWARVHRSL